MKDLFTPKEIRDAGFIIVPTPSFITDKDCNLYTGGYCNEKDTINGKYPLLTTVEKFHNQNKEKIFKEMNLKKIKFIYSIQVNEKGIVFIRACKNKEL